jgi:hypothetical protein
VNRRRCEDERGSSGSIIGGRGSAREGWPSIMVIINGFYATEGGGWVNEGSRRGRVKDLIRHLST